MYLLCIMYPLYIIYIVNVNNYLVINYVSRDSREVFILWAQNMKYDYCERMNTEL